MAKFILTTTLTFFITFASTLAVASNNNESSRDFYIGLDAGISKFGDTSNAQDVLSTADSVKLNDKHFVLGLNAGYHIHPRAAIEVGFLSGGERGSYLDDLFASTTTTHGYNLIYADAVGNLKITNSFKALGSIGIARVSRTEEVRHSPLFSGTSTEAERKNNNIGVKLGTGFQYDFNSRFALRTKADYVTGNGGLGIVTAGIQVKF